MVRKRNSRRLHEYEEEALHRRMGNQTYEQPNTRRPHAETSDLGSDLGWARYLQEPRTGLEVRGYRNAVDHAEHAHHKAHTITESVHEKTVGRDQAKAANYKLRKQRLLKKEERLQERKTRIATRQDVPSKIYDTAKSKAKSGAKKTARAGKKWVGGITSAPRVYREARDGGAGNAGRVQERINSAARNLGVHRGRRKATAS